MIALYKLLSKEEGYSFYLFAFLIGMIFPYYVMVYIESAVILAKYIHIHYLLILLTIAFCSIHFYVDDKRYGILERNHQYLLNIVFLVACFFLSILDTKKITVLYFTPLPVGSLLALAINLYFWFSYVVTEIIEKEDEDF